MNMNTALNSFFFQALTSVHTAVPATIVEYSSSTHVAKVKPSVNHVLDNGLEFELPDIASVPVIFPCSSKFSIDFPLNKGDGVLLVFCESDLGEWRESSGHEAVSPSNTLRFQLGNAVAIPGLMPKYEEPSCVLHVDDGGVVTFKGSKAVFNCPLVCNEQIISRKEVYVGADDASGVSLSTHVHPTAVGPTAPATKLPNPYMEV